VEVLIPDFQGDEAALRTVMDAAPDVLNHNIETVPRLYKQVRMGARYERSLELLARAKAMKPSIPTKSGLMVGLGESNVEVVETLKEMRAHGVEIATIGQYLRPTPMNLPVLRYVTPAEFAEFKRAGLGMGFSHVESGPLVRSSYHAHEAVPV
jgi:lipoic acid synthetase